MLLPRTVRIGALEYEYTPWDVYYWFVVLASLFILACSQRLQYARIWMRFRRIANGGPVISNPSNAFSRIAVYATQVARSVAYYQPPCVSRSFIVPPMITILLLTGHMGLLFALQFFPPVGAASSQGFRAGWLALAQLPLLIALVGKNNLVTLTTRISYERLNVFHRWMARSMLIFASLHLYYFYRAWGVKPGLFHLSFFPARATPTGFAAFAILIWMNISTLGPIRKLCYEFFFLQHIISWLGLFICLALHLPADEQRSQIYLYLPLALYFLDRLFRCVLSAYHFRKGLPLTMLTPYPTSNDGKSEGYTKVVISSPPFTDWYAGSHVLLTFPAFAPFESHPATIISTPKSHAGAVICLFKAETGFTRILGRYATDGMPSTDPSIPAALPSATTKVRISQPFSSHVLPMSGFETAVLLSAGSGGTYTISLLHALAEDISINSATLPVRKVRFLWVVRSLVLVKALLPELSTVIKRLDARGVDVRVELYNTAVPTQTNSARNAASARRSSPNTLSSDETLAPTLPEPIHPARDPPPSATGLDICPLPDDEKTLTPSPPLATSQPRRSSDETLTHHLTTADVDDADEATIRQAFIPAPPAREASVVADRCDLEKGEWRLYSARVSSVVSATKHHNNSSNNNNGGPTSGGQRGRSVGTCAAGGEGPGLAVDLCRGRPDLRRSLSGWAREAEGEMGVVACGPPEFGADVRRGVARLGFTGKAGSGIWLRVEGY